LQSQNRLENSNYLDMYCENVMQGGAGMQEKFQNALLSYERDRGLYLYAKFTLEQSTKAHTFIFLTSALDGVGWSKLRPGRFTPRKKTRYPFYRKLGGPQGRSGRVRKTLPPPEFDPPIVQPVASRYTDWTIL
jgi:hypothetical protein